MRPPREEVNFISREGAREKVRNHWLDTLSKEQLLAKYEPYWDRLRNYELEYELCKCFGGEWAINELCPFDGRYCSWGYYAPEEQKAEWLREEREYEERMRREQQRVW